MTTVQIPGSRQLSADVRNRLAAQVSVTLTKAVHIGEITIVDGDSPVVVPRGGGHPVLRTDFSDAEGPPPPAAGVYYLRRTGGSGARPGRALRGPLGNGALPLRLGGAGPTGDTAR